MKHTLRTAAGLAVVLALGLASTALAQQTEVMNSGPAKSEDWHPFSHTATRVYLADVGTLTVEGDVTRLNLARVPSQGPATDIAHSVASVEFRCEAKQSRSTAETEFAADGSQGERFEDASEWDAYSETSRDGYLAKLACDGERSAKSWTSIKAYIEGGRRQE